jgi:hypothetical protein
MTEDRILNAAQREDLARFTGDAAAATLDDATLLARAADRIGMSGEMAVDPEGTIELQRDDILVVIESVSEEDHELVDHPEMLHLAILLRPGSKKERTAFEKANLLDTPEPGQDTDEWAYAWWGSMCTKLPRETGISAQMEALDRVMVEAEKVVQKRDLTGFFDRMAWLQHEDDVLGDDDFDDDDLDDDGWDDEEEVDFEDDADEEGEERE